MSGMHDMKTMSESELQVSESYKGGKARRGHEAIFTWSDFLALKGLTRH